MTPCGPTTFLPSLPAAAPPPSGTRPWQRHPWTQLLCALALAIPMAAIAFRVNRLQATGLTVRILFLGPMVGGGLLIFWILLLHLVVCGEGLDRLGFTAKRPGLDIVQGAGLAAGLLAFHHVFQATAARLLPPRPPVPGVLELLASVTRSPWLLALWLGPVVWIGVALFEELARAFLLRRLWRGWPGLMDGWGAIVAVSGLTGLVHLYQGPAAIVSIGLQSLVMGWIFWKTGRVGVLIVGHALYDSVQVIAAAITIRQMGL